jgi:hypothetical protein
LAKTPRTVNEEGATQTALDSADSMLRTRVNTWERAELEKDYVKVFAEERKLKLVRN